MRLKFVPRLRVVRYGTLHHSLTILAARSLRRVFCISDTVCCVVLTAYMYNFSPMLRPQFALVLSTILLSVPVGTRVIVSGSDAPSPDLMDLFIPFGLSGCRGRHHRHRARVQFVFAKNGVVYHASIQRSYPQQ